MADIFRKSSLDKLSSPEQLDKAITIISPSFWIAAAGGGLIIAIALVWSIIGRLPVNASANGIYMGMDGMHSVVAEADGIAGWITSVLREFDAMIAQASGIDVFGIMLLLEDSFERIMNRRER